MAVPAGRAGREAARAERSLAGLTVLIVEDEILIAMELEDLLTDHGATCLDPVGSIGKALTTIEGHRVDMAFLDVRLRGESIDPVADRLAAAGTPFLFITSYGVDALPPAHRHRPMIAKPYGDSTIIRAFAEHCPN